MYHSARTLMPLNIRFVNQASACLCMSCTSLTFVRLHLLFHIFSRTQNFATSVLNQQIRPTNVTAVMASKMPPRRLSNSKSQINFLPKAPQRRGSTSSVQRNNSLAAAYRPSRSFTPPKTEHIQEIDERRKSESGLAYFSVWKGVKALWRGIDWCLGRMSSGWKGF